MALKVENLTKSFDSKNVLNDISFSVKKDEVFGLLGPNGAGKTTMIRTILNILKPDAGEVEIFGKTFSEKIKERIGYLPEESGLYKKIKVFDCIKYFATLKGMGNVDSKIDYWLKKLNLQEYKNKNVQELSKGMQRQLQFIISIIHNPDILILDEPFYGLDPINKKLNKDIILELKNKGMTIIMSTHQIDEVERMCDRILMINKGRKVLYGNLNEIKSKYGFSLMVEYEGKLPKPEGIKKVNDYGNYAELILEKDANTQNILKTLVGKVELKKFEVKTRSLNEIFIEVVENEK
ncbi:MAG: ATP-binding cassette domain-containing protein [Minisyncoccales bacterium]